MDLAASHNNIQELQAEDITWDADLREAREGFFQARIAMVRETTKVNQDQLSLRKLHADR